MNERSDSIVLAEQQVAEARTAALAEYQAARAKLRRRLGSPVFIGGVLLGAIALGYLALGRGKPKRPVDPGSAGAWPRVGKIVQVLLPLLMALNSVTKAAHTSRADISGTPR
jgi:GAF domain-containing protein